MIFFFCTVLEVCKDVLCCCLCTTVWEDKLKSELEHRVPLPGRRPVWIAVPLLVHGFFFFNILKKVHPFGSQLHTRQGLGMIKLLESRTTLSRF